MADSYGELLRDTLDLLILKSLTWGPRHGYAIAEWIETATGRALLVEEGTLYPALHRLEHQGLIEAAPVDSSRSGRPDSRSGPISTSRPTTS